MVEQFQFRENEPAFITLEDFPTDRAYPASWLLEDDNKLSVFEYSTDLFARNSLENFEKRTEFLEITDLKSNASSVKSVKEGKRGANGRDYCTYICKHS
nr:5540_t:CDS:2 [Entrophospora candida]